MSTVMTAEEQGAPRPDLMSPTRDSLMPVLVYTINRE